jgi:hypothetical protein
MYIIMKTLCLLGINIHNLKYRQNSTSAVPQVNRVNVPCMEQPMPNPTSPCVYQLPKVAGACLAGLNKLFFGDLIFGELVLTAVLHLS